MFVKETLLLAAPLGPYLRKALAQQESDVMGVTDVASLTPERVGERVKPLKVPELIRDEAEFDTHERGDKVVVRVKIPVTGDVELLEFLPEGSEYVGIRAKITDDLARGADKQGDSYTNDRWDPQAKTHPRGGFVLSEEFPSSATASEIKGWARDLLDEIDSFLPALREQAAAHEEHARSVLAERAEARRKTLTTVSNLKDQLGKGL